MKKTIIAILALAGIVSAADLITTEYTPLKEQGWNLTSARSAYTSNTAKQNIADGTIYADDPWWKRPYATYDFSKSLTLSGVTDSLSFSFDMTMSLVDAPWNGLCSVAIKGNADSAASTIMMGYGGAYNATTNTHFKTAVVANNTSSIYLFGTDWDSEYYNCTSADQTFTLPSQAESGKTEFTTNYSGLIAWNEEKSSFILTLTQTYEGQQMVQEYSLGSTYDMTGLSIAMDGNSTNGDKDIFTISNMTITHTIPEPTTATLSLLALAGLVARRRRK